MAYLTHLLEIDPGDSRQKQSHSRFQQERPRSHHLTLLDQQQLLDGQQTVQLIRRDHSGRIKAPLALRQLLLTLVQGEQFLLRLSHAEGIRLILVVLFEGMPNVTHQCGVLHSSRVPRLQLSQFTLLCVLRPFRYQSRRSPVLPRIGYSQDGELQHLDGGAWPGRGGCALHQIRGLGLAVIGTE